jgi:hypothetical protein
MRITIVSLLLSFLALPGCDALAKSVDEAVAKEVAKAGAAPDAAKTPAGPVEIVLESTEVAGLGTLKLPKGMKQSEHVKSHWELDLGNHEAIRVSWEPHGAKDLKDAESLATILASTDTVKSSSTLPSGYHEIERTRSSDGYGFIALFGKDWYVMCTPPAGKMDVCREIVRSKS